MDFHLIRWLMVALLVSLGALLLAAAGVARHIWRQKSLISGHSAAAELPGETEPETEP